MGSLLDVKHRLTNRTAPGPDWGLGPASSIERRFAALCSLVGEPTEAEHAVAGRLAPYLKAILAGLNAVESFSLSGEELAMLLRKEQLNSYGVLASQQQVAAAAALQIGISGVCGSGGGTTCGGGVSAGCSSNNGGAEMTPGEGEDGLPCQSRVSSQCRALRLLR
ncbi:hypothetical protein Vafri_6979 [Volvox africanus]|uniref:Uncharacterized protein n=1 Tax=Volvox africanus TaxID=51714 RepID=A0A8J4B453_9CHLO|nr:hypothetical protein Vafri_6979 [Volvox africanus]